METDPPGFTHLSGVTVYYPYDLLLFDGLSSDEENNEILHVSFLDGDGCEITLRVRRSALEALAARLRRRSEALESGEGRSDRRSCDERRRHPSQHEAQPSGCACALPQLGGDHNAG